MKNLQFGNVVTDIVGDEQSVNVKSNKEYTLYINDKVYEILKVIQTIKLK